jgi:hypothetical protein
MRRPPDIERGCECMKQATADNRQRMTLQLEETGERLTTLYSKKLAH